MAEYQTNLEKLADAQAKQTSAASEMNNALAAKNEASRLLALAREKKEGGYCAREFSNKSKRQTCQAAADADFTKKLAEYDKQAARYATAVSAHSIADDLVTKYEKQVDSDIANSGTLANMGLTTTAIEQAAITVAQGQSQAAVLRGEAEAETIVTTGKANAKSIEESAIADADAKKKNNMVFLIVGILAALLLGIFLYNKFKKIKK